MTSKNKELPTLIVDSREGKGAWDFEGDEDFAAIEHTKLDAADYAIKGLEHILVIERKASADELYINFTKDRERIKAEFERLKSHPFKFIIVEATCEDVFNPLRYYINKRKLNRGSPKMPGGVVTSNLIDLMLLNHVQVIFGGDKAQAIAKRILLRAYELHGKGKLI